MNTADDEDEEESGGLVTVYRWSWLAYACSAANLAKCIVGNVAGHLEDVVSMMTTEVRHQQETHKFKADVLADIERIPETKD